MVIKYNPYNWDIRSIEDKYLEDNKLSVKNAQNDLWEEIHDLEHQQLQIIKKLHTYQKCNHLSVAQLVFELKIITDEIIRLWEVAKRIGIDDYRITLEICEHWDKYDND